MAAVMLWIAAQPAARGAEVSFCPIPGSRLNASVESLAEQRWKHVIRQGLDISCGSAALATIINYQFGDQVSEDAIIRTILANVKAEEVRKRGGFSLLDLKKVGAALGYTVKGYKLSLQDLMILDTPALVPITVRGFKHFVVFRGSTEERVALADPSFGNIVISTDDFLHAWQGIALVLSRQGTEQRQSDLEIAPHDLPWQNQPEAFHNFINRDVVRTGLRDADEF